MALVLCLLRGLLAVVPFLALVVGLSALQLVVFPCSRLLAKTTLQDNVCQ